ncbi:MAG: hypothetical protein ACOZAK_01460 [Patescibacteria group bacterium]
MHERLSIFELTPGRINIPVSDHGINTHSELKDVLERTRLINSEEWLEKVCAEETCGIYLSPTGTRFGFVRPVAPYADWDLMPMVFPKKIESTLETEEIYDYPVEDQLIYWRILTTGLDQAKKVMAEHEPQRPHRVFATQNSNHFLSNEKHRGARSIHLIHARILGFYLDNITAAGEVDSNGQILQPGVPDHLWQEWGLMRKSETKIVAIVKKYMRAESLQFCEFAIREAPPFGYSLIIPGPENIDYGQEAWLEKVQQVTADHYQAYSQISNNGELARILGAENIKFPQPSFRFYASLENNTLELIHSPIILSHAGPIEAAGIILHRNQAVLSPEKLAQKTEHEDLFYQAIISKL